MKIAARAVVRLQTKYYPVGCDLFMSWAVKMAVFSDLCGATSALLCCFIICKEQTLREHSINVYKK